MIPEAELARALARWKARKLGAAPVVQDEGTGEIDAEAHVEAVESEEGQSFDEPTRVAEDQYESEVQTPPADVRQADGEFEAPPAPRRR